MRKFNTHMLVDKLLVFPYGPTLPKGQVQLNSMVTELVTRSNCLTFETILHIGNRMVGTHPKLAARLVQEAYLHDKTVSRTSAFAALSRYGYLFHAVMLYRKVKDKL